MVVDKNTTYDIKVECLVAFIHSRISGLAGKDQNGIEVFSNKSNQKKAVYVGDEIQSTLDLLCTVEIINEKISKSLPFVSSMYHYHYTKLLNLLDKEIPKDGELIEGLIGLHLLVMCIENKMVGDEEGGLLEYFKETIEMYENENYTSCEKVKETVKFMREVSSKVFNQYWEKPKRKSKKRK